MRSFDLTDVPPVAEDDLALAIRAMMETDQVAALVKSPTQLDRAAIEDAFWCYFHGATATGVATLVRFWCLVDALQARRLRKLLTLRGHAFFGAAATAAASQRLNLDWGFNPQRLIWAIGSVRPVVVARSRKFEEASDVWLAA